MNLTKLTDAIVQGKLEPAVEIIKMAIENGNDPQTLISDYLIQGMEEIGKQFGEGRAFVPNLLMSARAMKGCLDLLKPLMKGSAKVSYGTIVIGTVKGDLHDIGKNLVASMFEGCGFEVINVGVDVSSDRFIAAVKEHKADILCLSALLTTTMNYMHEVVKALEESGLRRQVKVMIGGAPLNEAFAVKIGADAFSSNANEAVQVAKRLMKKEQ